MRPAPESTIRSCGTALTTATKLGTYTQWQPLANFQIGAFFLPPAAQTSPNAFAQIWATGTGAPLRPTAGLIVDRSNGDDLTLEQAIGGLQLSYQDPRVGSTASAFRDGDPALWYVTPSETLLTSATVRGSHEPAWSLAGALHRTAATSTIGSDQFVRALTAGNFFGYELTLLMPSTCAVGALSDALKKPAFIGSPSAGSGIFAAATLHDVQDVLVKNGAVMQVRVIANKQNTAVESLFAATACSPGNLTACASLLTALSAENDRITTAIASTPSDLTKLQAGTDPLWSTVAADTARVSILPP